MKRTGRLLTVLMLALLCNAANAQAQIIVKVRPRHAVVVRTPAPSPRHVWVEEDWAPQDGTYVWHGGYWAEPPHPGWIWRPGHWRNRPGGYVWIPGHWVRR